MEPDLIYDIGMHRGEDTDLYLREGYRVVAVEADPTLAEAARRRFAEAIATGRLTLLQVAIGPRQGTARFWISSRPEHSSLDRQRATQYGGSASAIEVPCRPFADILREHGVPYYLKVDIEAADHYCLEALDPGDLPRYLSFEKSRLEDLFTARRKGYTRFKLISQEAFRQLVYRPDAAASVRRLLKRLRRARKRMLRPARPLIRSLTKRASGGGGGSPPAAGRAAVNRFPPGSSGPFGEETDGPWRSFEDVAFTWLAYDRGLTGAADPQWESWFDVHCAREPA